MRWEKEREGGRKREKTHTLTLLLKNDTHTSHVHTHTYHVHTHTLIMYTHTHLMYTHTLKE